MSAKYTPWIDGIAALVARKRVAPRLSVLLAVAPLAAQSVAGLLTAAAASDAAHSLLQSVRITPADVQRVVVEAAPRSAPAGGATGVRLQTGLLADAYGNLLPDGAAVFFAHKTQQVPVNCTVMMRLSHPHAIPAQSGFVHRLTKCSKHADQIITALSYRRICPSWVGPAII